MAKMCPGSSAESCLQDQPGCLFQRSILVLLLMISHVMAADTLELRMGVQADCDTGEMDINRMHFVRTNAYCRTICIYKGTKGLQKKMWVVLWW